MIRPLLIVLLAGAIGAAEPVQPVLLPQPELARRLDPAKEWVFLPVAEWRRLVASAERPAPSARPGTGLAGGRVIVACSVSGCIASAELVATVDAGTAAAVTLFAERPERLDALTVSGSPGLALPDRGALAVLLPGAGRWPLGARWSQPAPADADAGWSASIPLPLAAALDVIVTAPPDWEVVGNGLVADGSGRWHLAGTMRQLAFTLRPAGSQVRAWGASQSLAVELPAAGAGGTFSWGIGAGEGSVPDVLRLRLPAGFTATDGGEAQADGSVLVRPATGEPQQKAGGHVVCVRGIVAAGAAIDLPVLDGARWQGGGVSISIAAPALLPTPDGWLPVGEGLVRSAGGARHFALAAPGHPLVPLALAGASGLDVRSAAAVAVGGGSVRATWGLEIRSAAPLHRLEATIPRGWRVLAADAGGVAIELPPEDEVLAQPWPLAVALPKALAPGAVQLLVLTLERQVAAEVPVDVPTVAGAVRSSSRVLIAADPASEVTVQPPRGSWRLGPAVASEAGLEAVAELLASDDAPPLALAVRPRPVRLDAEAACWLLARAEDCQVRLDLRLSAAGGALDAVSIALPAALAEGWTVEAGAAVLRDGTLAWPAPWTGERLVRLSGRLALSEGRAAAVRPVLQLAGREVPLRLAVAALAGERVDVTAVPSGRALEPDELPRWSAPPAGTRVLAAWRPSAGEAGAVTARAPQLHEPPAGFLDRVELRTQLSPGGGITLLSARLAAPGLAALPIALPPGMSLELAQVDGEPAPVRRDGEGRCAVVLPGRTQVQLALRLAHPAAPGDFRLALPDIALPWLATAWTVAVAPAWRAEPLAGDGAMPLEHQQPQPRRRLFGSWWTMQSRGEEESPPVRRVHRPDPPPADPRLLGGAPVLPPRVLGQEAVLALHGPQLGGQRIGAPAGLHLHLAEVAALQNQDRIGRIAGLVAGLGLIGLILLRRMLAWRCLALAAAAGCGAAGLLLAQVAAGPLLGLCEALLVLAPLAAVVHVVVLRGSWFVVRGPALLLVLAAGLATAETPGVVLMGYARIGADGQLQGVTVALSRERFAALVADAKAATPPGEVAPDLAIGPGSWNGAWRDGRWTFTGSVPVAAPGAAWGEVRLPMPGTVATVLVQPLGGAPAPTAPAWRMDGDSLVLALPPRSQALLAITAMREAAAGSTVAMTFPPGGTLSLEAPPGLVPSLASPLGLPARPVPVGIAVDRPSATADSGSLGLLQELTLRHLGDHIAWNGNAVIDSQRQPPGVVELLLPPRLDVLMVRGDGLAGWRQREGRLELRWSAAARERSRRVELAGVITGAGPAVPALALPGAVRGGGWIAVVDAGPVRWTMPEGIAGLRRVQPGDGERFRLAWDGDAPAGLALAYTAAATQLSAASDGLLVIASGRWRAEVAFTLAGGGLADHLRVAVPAPWRVVSAEGAQWLPDAGGGVLRGVAALAAGARLVLRCEAPEGAEGLPRIAVASDGIAIGRVRWLVADRGGLRASISGPATDAEALAADLARAGIRPRPDERTRAAVEARPGSATTLTVSAAERRQRLEAAHYLIAGAGAVRWASHITVQPEQGALDRVRIRLPAGARLTDRRGEAVAEWSEADGWLTARFAAPLDRPAALDLAFTVDWGEAAGRERSELAAFACEPALDRETVALAEDEEAGQLVRRPDGLEERPATAVPLPAGVAPALLAGRTWIATGTAWKLGLERERLDQGLGADAVATLVDAHSAIDPDGRLMSRATWYVINRSRSALDLVLPEGCALWEIRLGGQAVRARRGTSADRVVVPVNPLRPGEAATRIQVCWAQAAGDGLRPRLPVFPELRVMRALWRFTAPPGTRLRHVDGWEPVPSGDATGARVEVLADELKRLRSSSEESPAVRARLADQLLLIDQELTDHVAVLERLGQDPSRWTGDVAVRQADVQTQNEYQQRSQSFNIVANDNRQAVREKLGKLTTVAKAQRDRRGGLLLDAQAVRWSHAAVRADAGPDWAPRRAAQAMAGSPEVLRIGEGLGAGAGAQAATATAALTGIDLLPAQDAGEELTLRADSLSAQPLLRLESGDSGARVWGVWLLLGLAALALGVGISRRRP